MVKKLKGEEPLSDALKSIAVPKRLRGLYLQVIQPGVVRIGDEVRVLERAILD